MVVLLSLVLTLLSATGGQAVAPQPASMAAPPAVETRLSRITFYDCSWSGFCGLMRNGETVWEGAAACDYRRLGDRFLLQDREFVCADTGSAVWGDHVDLFFYHYADGRAFLDEYGEHQEVHWLLEP